MKARPLFLCLLTAALCAIPALAQDEANPAAPKADKSGQMEKRRQEMLKRFDANGDGKLDDTEKAAMKEALKQERAVRGSGDIGSLSAGAGEAGPRGDLFVREMLKRFDKDGDGKLDAAELGEMMKARGAAGGQGLAGGPMRPQIMKLFDKNGDGKLDDEERAAAEKFRDEQVKRFDKNGDGQLDPEERAEAMKAFLADHPEMMPPGK
ncbi:MAG: EF-hand domain-containing protein [bacterium]|nr:EF-hand domain-containing protein [bacterium]MDI1337132.1 EF-hand domain-containing protein [Lacunisphaera sp.]